MRAALDTAVPIAPPSKEEAQLELLAQLAFSRFGEPLLSAHIREELDDTLDGLVQDSEVLHVLTLVAAVAPAVPTVEHVDEVARDALSEGPASVLQRDGILDRWFAATRQAMTSGRLTDLQGLAPNDIAPTDLLTSPRVAPEIAEAVAAQLRFALCVLAIAGLAGKDAPAEPWLELALVERMVEGARKHLCFLASIPGVEVPLSVISQAERLDFAAIRDRHIRARRRADASYGRAGSRLTSWNV